MNNFVKLKKLFENDQFVGDCVGNFLIVNCEHLAGDTPKPVYLKREKCAGCGDIEIKYTLTFIAPTAEEVDTLSGLWVVQDGHGVMVDANDVDNVFDACRNCCDGDPVVITTEYTNMTTGVSTFDAITGGSSASYCVTRADDGSTFAMQKFERDYYGRVATIVRFSASGTSSKYTVTSVGGKPAAMLPDTIATSACS